MTLVAPIRVAIVEDDRGTRDALALLIGGTPGLQCAAAFGSLEAALAALDRTPADVLLLDIHLPGMSGSQGVRLLRDRYPSMQVVMLTVFDEDEHIFESLCNGACGFLLKRTPPARLLDAIREAHEGGSPMTPAIARRVVAAFQKPVPPPGAAHGLSPHEVRIVGMLAAGDSYLKIGERLGVSVNTVRNYIRSIYEKLHVHTKSEAVGKAFRGRLLS